MIDLLEFGFLIASTRKMAEEMVSKLSDDQTLDFAAFGKNTVFSSLLGLPMILTHSFLITSARKVAAEMSSKLSDGQTLVLSALEQNTMFSVLGSYGIAYVLTQLGNFGQSMWDFPSRVFEILNHINVSQSLKSKKSLISVTTFTLFQNAQAGAADSSSETTDFYAHLFLAAVDSSLQRKLSISKRDYNHIKGVLAHQCKVKMSSQTTPSVTSNAQGIELCNGYGVEHKGESYSCGFEKLDQNKAQCTSCFLHTPKAAVDKTKECESFGCTYKESVPLSGSNQVSNIKTCLPQEI